MKPSSSGFAWNPDNSGIILPEFSSLGGKLEAGQLHGLDRVPFLGNPDHPVGSNVLKVLRYAACWPPDFDAVDSVRLTDSYRLPQGIGPKAPPTVHMAVDRALPRWTFLLEHQSDPGPDGTTVGAGPNQLNCNPVVITTGVFKESI